MSKKRTGTTGMRYYTRSGINSFKSKMPRFNLCTHRRGAWGCSARVQSRQRETERTTATVRERQADRDKERETDRDRGAEGQRDGRGVVVATDRRR